MYFREYTGFIQRRTMAGARNIEEVKELVDGNPVYEGGGRIEVLEEIPE